MSACDACGHLIGLPFKSFRALDLLGEDDPGPVSVTGSRKRDFGGDAVIVGDVGAAFHSFHGESQGPAPVEGLSPAPVDSGVNRQVVPAPLYVDASTAQMIAPDAVVRLSKDADLENVSPFERHVAGFINGDRPVARVGEHAQVGEDDLRIAMAMLADRGALELVGFAREAGDDSPLDGAALGIELVPVEDAGDAEAAPASRVGSAAAADEAPAIQVLPLPGADLPPLTPRRDGAARAAPKAAAGASDASPAPPPPGASAVANEAAENAELSEAELARLPKDVRLYRQAMEKEQFGDYDTAIRMLRHALHVNPRAASVLNLLGVILATRRKEYKEAIDLLLKACELEPLNAAYKRNLEKVMEHGVDDTGRETSSKPGKKKGFLRSKLF